MIRTSVYFLVFSLLYLAISIDGCAIIKRIRDIRDLHLTMEQRLHKFGYPSEVHYVTTKDGYILTLYRVPHGRLCKENQKKRKTPILVMHGLFCSSNDYIAAGVDEALGYVLPDSCFDTWLSNARGTFESKNHTRLSTCSKDFWDFTWHEMGKYDLPAVIDHILEKTGAEQIQYIGHSEGTTQFFVYASLYPEESAKKVKSFHAMAPVVFFQSTHLLFRLSGRFNQVQQTVGDSLGVYQIPHLWITGKLLRKFCLLPISREVKWECRAFFYYAFGYDNREFNTTLYPIFFTKVPAGISTKQLTHYGQVLHSREFKQYDYYNTRVNTALYKNPHPPKYNLEEIKVPTYLYYSHEDALAREKGVLKLHKITSKTSTLVPVNRSFSHFDFIYGNNVRKIVYDGIIHRLIHS